jgi:hypothetical protein
MNDGALREVARDYVGKLKVKTPSVEQETLRLIVDARARPLPFPGRGRMRAACRPFS